MTFNPAGLLSRALLLSIFLHSGIIAAFLRIEPSVRDPRRELAALAVRLRDTPPQVVSQEPAPVAPRFMLPPQSQPNASAGRPVIAAPVQRDKIPQGLSGEAARSAMSQISRVLLYPREAIEQGIEGQATVLLFLDESGNAIAARLETSSGHEVLDDAAVRAARTLRALPGGAPREALLPVRFRLR